MSKQDLSDAGTYRFGQLTRNEEELERLKLQATIAIDLEKEAWAEAGLRPGMKVLDLGCGPGFTSCELAKMVGNGEVLGVDLNKELLAVAYQAKEFEGVENVSFQPGNIYTLDLPENSFDFVYTRFVFQHLEKPELALSNIRKVLKPGGVLCILDIDDNWTSFSPESDAFVKFIRHAGTYQKHKGSNRLVGSQLFGLLKQAGYEEVSTRIEALTSEDIGVRYFLGVAVLFRFEMMSKLQKLLALPQLRKIKKAAQDENAWGAVGIFLASGRKK